MASDKGSCEKAGPLTAAGVARLADAKGAGVAGEDGWFMPDYPGSGPKRGARRDSTPVNGGVAPGAESHEAHGDGRARRVEDVPAPAQEDLDVGVEVGGAQRRVGAEVDAGGKARRDVQRAAQRDHQVSEVAAHAPAFVERVDGRGGAGGRVA